MKSIKYKSMDDKLETLTFDGVLRPLGRAKPWSPVKVEYKNRMGKSEICDVPLPENVMNEILSSSNFQPRLAFMQEAAKVFFQGSVSKCPDGDDYVIKDENGRITCEVNALDRDGCLWRLRIEVNAGKYHFSATKKKKIYRGSALFGG